MYIVWLRMEFTFKNYYYWVLFLKKKFVIGSLKKKKIRFFSIFVFNSFIKLIEHRKLLKIRVPHEYNCFFPYHAVVIISFCSAFRAYNSSLVFKAIEVYFVVGFFLLLYSKQGFNICLKMRQSKTSNEPAIFFLILFESSNPLLIIIILKEMRFGG